MATTLRWIPSRRTPVRPTTRFRCKHDLRIGTVFQVSLHTFSRNRSTEHLMVSTSISPLPPFHRIRIICKPKKAVDIRRQTPLHCRAELSSPGLGCAAEEAGRRLAMEYDHHGYV